MPRAHPREPRHVRGINRWRAWCGESRTPGSEGSCTEKARVHPLGTRDLAVQLTLLNVLAKDTDPETGEPETGSPHVLIIRPPGGKLTWLRAMGSRRHEAIIKILAFFTGLLISDGYEAYPKLLPQLAGLQQCCQHIIRRCRAVTKLGPGGLQSWAADVIEILREARRLTGEAR